MTYTPYDAEAIEAERTGNEPSLIRLMLKREGYLRAKEEHADLLDAAEAAGDALHQFHPQEHTIPIGKGICGWGPCKQLRDAIAKAKDKSEVTP